MYIETTTITPTKISINTCMLCIIRKRKFSPHPHTFFTLFINFYTETEFLRAFTVLLFNTNVHLRLLIFLFIYFVLILQQRYNAERLLLYTSCTFTYSIHTYLYEYRYYIIIIKNKQITFPVYKTSTL